MDKVTVEVRAETAGKLVALFAEEGATVEVGADLYELDLDVTARAAAPVAVPVPPPAPSTPSAAPPPAAAPVAAAVAGGRIHPSG